MWATTPSSKAAIDLAQPLRRQALLEDREHRALQHVLDDLALAALLEASRSRSCRTWTTASASRSQIRGHDLALARAQRPAHGVGGEHLEVRHAEAHRHAGALVHVATLAGEVGERRRRSPPCSPGS